MLANWITLARLPLLALCLGILYLGSPAMRIVGAALTSWRSGSPSPTSA